MEKIVECKVLQNGKLNLKSVLYVLLSLRVIHNFKTKLQELFTIKHIPQTNTFS